MPTLVDLNPMWAFTHMLSKLVNPHTHVHNLVYVNMRCVHILHRSYICTERQKERKERKKDRQADRKKESKIEKIDTQGTRCMNHMFSIMHVGVPCGVLHGRSPRCPSAWGVCPSI